MDTSSGNLHGADVASMKTHKSLNLSGELQILNISLDSLTRN